MSKATILTNDLFDDGTLECFNYWLADDEGCRQVDAAFVLDTLGLRDLIAANVSKGYISVSKLGLVYGGLQICVYTSVDYYCTYYSMATILKMS